MKYELIITGLCFNSGLLLSKILPLYTTKEKEARYIAQRCNINKYYALNMRIDKIKLIEK